MILNTLINITSTLIRIVCNQCKIIMAAKHTSGRDTPICKPAMVFIVDDTCFIKEAIINVDATEYVHMRYLFM